VLPVLVLVLVPLTLVPVELLLVEEYPVDVPELLLEPGSPMMLPPHAVTANVATATPPTSIATIRPRSRERWSVGDEEGRVLSCIWPLSLGDWPDEIARAQDRRGRTPASPPPVGGVSHAT